MTCSEISIRFWNTLVIVRQLYTTGVLLVIPLSSLGTRLKLKSFHFHHLYLLHSKRMPVLCKYDSLFSDDMYVRLWSDYRAQRLKSENKSGVGDLLYPTGRASGWKCLLDGFPPVSRLIRVLLSPLNLSFTLAKFRQPFCKNGLES